MKTLHATAIVALATVTGCGPETTAPHHRPTAASAELSSDRLDLFVSESDSLLVGVWDEAGRSLDLSAQWSSSDVGVATVEGGHVLAIDPGRAKISVVVGGLTAEADVYVARPVPLVLPIEGEVNGDYFMTYYPAHIAPDGNATDFQCGRKAVFAHTGTDFALLDMPTMKQGVVVRAAADGIVERVHDGESDVHVFIDSTAVANEVVLDHGNGIRTVYSHLKQGIQVTEGAQVEAGEAIAMVGSSGISWMPHLHFELRLYDRAVDPFSGPCASSLSHWAEDVPYQGEYRLLTSRVSDYQLRAPPHLILDSPPHADTIYTGRTFVAWVQELNTTAIGSSIRLIDGAGAVYGDYLQFPAGGPLGLSWHSMRTLFEDDVATGTWTMEYRYEGELRSQVYFEVARR